MLCFDPDKNFIIISMHEIYDFFIWQPKWKILDINIIWKYVHIEQIGHHLPFSSHHVKSMYDIFHLISKHALWNLVHGHMMVIRYVILSIYTHFMQFNLSEKLSPRLNDIDKILILKLIRMKWGFYRKPINPLYIIFADLLSKTQNWK